MVRTVPERATPGTGACTGALAEASSLSKPSSALVERRVIARVEAAALIERVLAPQQNAKESATLRSLCDGFAGRPHAAVSSRPEQPDTLIGARISVSQPKRRVCSRLFERQVRQAPH
jgi:hypothetical protein